ncbi:Lycopene epsilon cyclase, chloroplastic [Capsicum baccatum]|uniref:Lycopene epsilon cyclase, chloroplastic n=1 Tax=Capsicum baccatum TaxID=33114 RepID=A0A2G2VGK9_CAPBA|nr:Lycopene epsilon cyclase, chloroplastic [Capsicum baccatum]
MALYLSKVGVSLQLQKISAGQIMLDLVVISCGPVGLALATESAKLGLNMELVGPDFLFTNKYGNWEDEFKGVIHIDLPRCVEAGVLYHNSKVDSIFEVTSVLSLTECEGGVVIPYRFVTVASGAASRKFLQYELGGPRNSVQPAYGVEVEYELGGPRNSVQTAYGVEVQVGRDHQTLSNSEIFACYAHEYLNATSLREQIAALFIVSLSLLVLRCVEAGVLYPNSKVDRIFEVTSVLSFVECEGDVVIPYRFVTVASGADLRKFLQYELGGPRNSVQTTYGVEVEVDNNPYDLSLRVFMDYRDYVRYDTQSLEAKYPSFLYSMPMTPTRGTLQAIDLLDQFKIGLEIEIPNSKFITLD